MNFIFKIVNLTTRQIQSVQNTIVLKHIGFIILGPIKLKMFLTVLGSDVIQRLSNL